MTDSFLQLLARDPLERAEAGSRLFETLGELFPAASPREWEEGERFGGTDPASLERLWGMSLAWIGSRDDVRGYVGAALAAHDRSVVLLDFALSPGDASGAMAFLEQVAVDLQAEFGFFHLPTDMDRRAGLNAVSVLDQVAVRDLRRGVPYLYWATVFGGAYSRMFTRDRLIRAPVHRSEEIGPDIFVLQLTERPDDSIERWAAVDDARQAAMAYLGRDAFFDIERPQASRRLPAFQPIDSWLE